MFLVSLNFLCKTNVQNAVQNLPVGARLQNFWKTWLDLGAGLKVVQILKEGYTLPFWNRPKLTRSPTVISCYVNSHRNSYLMEALHQLIDKNAVELVQNQTSLGFFNRLFLVPKPSNKWRPVLDLSKLNLFLKAEKFKMETLETIRTSLQQGEWVNRFQGCLLPYTNMGIVQEISQISCPRSDIPVQSTAFWSVHSTLGVHCCSKGGETDGHTQGYKNQNWNQSRFSIFFLAGRIQPTPHRWQNLQDKILEILSLPACPAVHVSDRFTNSYRKASSPKPTTHETHTVAAQKQLKGTGVIRKNDSHSQVPAPPLAMVAKGRQRPHRPIITPNKTCSANFYRRINRRVVRSFKRTHCQRGLVTARKQAAYKLSGTKGSLSSLSGSL